MFMQSLPRLMKDLVPRLQAAVTMTDASMLRHVWENAVWCPAVCIKMDGGHFEHTTTKCPAILLWRVSWKLNITWYVLYNIANLFLTKNCTVENLLHPIYLTEQKSYIWHCNMLVGQNIIDNSGVSSVSQYWEEYEGQREPLELLFQVLCIPTLF